MQPPRRAVGHRGRLWAELAGGSRGVQIDANYLNPVKRPENMQRFLDRWPPRKVLAGNRQHLLCAVPRWLTG